MPFVGLSGVCAGGQLAKHAPGLRVVVYEGVRQRREQECTRRKPKRKAVRAPGQQGLWSS